MNPYVDLPDSNTSEFDACMEQHSLDYCDPRHDVNNVMMGIGNLIIWALVAIFIIKAVFSKK